MNKISLIILLCLLMASCAGIQAQKKMDAIKAELDPQIGILTRDAALNVYGPPSRREQINKTDVWIFHKSLGQEFRGRRSTERYEEIIMMFEANILVGWKTDVKY